MNSCDVAIVGAGPYGLSTAAHLMADRRSRTAAKIAGPATHRHRALIIGAGSCGVAARWLIALRAASRSIQGPASPQQTTVSGSAT